MTKCKWAAATFCFLLLVSSRGEQGTLDPAFKPGGGPNALVWSVAVQEDRKILIGGNFDRFNGEPAGYIARLNADGSRDESFQGGANYWVRAIKVQPDGGIVIGGDFTSVNGVSRNRIARLKPDGSLDERFDPGTGVEGKLVEAWPQDPNLFAVALQPDGKILIGGNFRSYNGADRRCLARLNADGSLDESFGGIGATDHWVRGITVARDGRILAGGWFGTFNEQPANRMARLNPDGSLDQSFQARFEHENQVYTMAEQRDGKIVVGGRFRISSASGSEYNDLARLLPNGEVDDAFRPPGTNGWVEHVLTRENDFVLAAGHFTQVSGAARNRLALLGPGGIPDPRFEPALDDGYVLAAEFQADGKLVIGGEFTRIQGASMPYIARLNTKPAESPTRPAPPQGLRITGQ